MSVRAEIYRDNEGEFRWRLRAANGEPIADSGEGYVRRRDAQHGLDLVLQAGQTDADDQEQAGE